MNDLEACPFCGTWDVIIKDQLMVSGEDACSHAPSEFRIYWVSCNNCRVFGSLHFTEQEAKDAWNTRREAQ